MSNSSEKQESVVISCTGSESIDYSELIDLQGGLKIRSQNDIDRMKRSIIEYGFSFPFFVWATKTKRYVLDGHGRIEALRELEDDGHTIPAVPIVYVEAKSKKEAKQKLLRLNSKYGEFSIEGIEDFIADIEVDWDEVVLPNGSLVFRPEPDPMEQDEVPEDVPERVSPGQIWKLGRHRLMCGDATNENNVAALLDGGNPILMVTDPPYGVNYDPAWRQREAEKGNLSPGARRVGKVENDDRADWSDAWRLFPGDVTYTWSPSGVNLIETGGALLASGFDIRGTIIWSKQHFAIGRGHYHGRHEPCWYAVRHGRTAHWIGDRKQSTIWEVARDKGVVGGHSTQKPVECMGRPIRNHDGDVYDPFVGSGTTIIAAEQMERTCYAMEIDPHYCDVVIERYRIWCENHGAEAAIELVQ